VVSALKTFLRHRGMELKVPDNKNYWFTFKPGTKITYLGFDFVFPNYRSKIFRKGKFTKLRLSSDTLGSERFSHYSRHQFFYVLIKML
jgi:hypothetical protein